MRTAICVVMVVLFLSACGPSAMPGLVPPAHTPTPMILADTFFIGCAFLDKNVNGLVDSEDAPLSQMRFLVTLAGGAAFGGMTGDNGCALVIIPAALPKTAWPVAIRMEVPQTFAYVPTGDVKTALTYPDTRADFLFIQP